MIDYLQCNVLWPNCYQPQIVHKQNCLDEKAVHMDFHEQNPLFQVPNQLELLVERICHLLFQCSTPGVKPKLVLYHTHMHRPIFLGGLYSFFAKLCRIYYIIAPSLGSKLIILTKSTGQKIECKKEQPTQKIEIGKLSLLRFSEYQMNFILFSFHEYFISLIDTFQNRSYLKLNHAILFLVL